jgi:hypothetical protein
MRPYRATLYIAFLSAALMLAGCAKDSDSDGGTDRDRFLGKWSVTETWTKLSYEVNITEDPGSLNGVFISNFAGTGASSIPASAEVNGTTIVLDANQVIGGGLIVNGYGTLSGSRISWSYTLDDGANLITAVATYTKI